MKRRMWAATAALVGLLALGALAGSLFGMAQAGAPGPSAGTMLADGLLSPRGIAVGPDGLIYVAEAGEGGTAVVADPDGIEWRTGFSGRISSIDPATGERTTVADGLPSASSGDPPEVQTLGPADVAFIGSQLYYVQTLGGEAYGFSEHPTGVYSIDAGGDATLVADIGTFNIDNPVPRIVSGEQQDITVGGNPYGMTTRDGVFYVVDSNYNQVLQATTAGVVSRLVDFNANTVPTGITYRASGGPLYVSNLGPGPFLPADGKIVSVAVPSGSVADVASGVPMLTAVDVGPADQLHALSFSVDFAPFSGSVQRVNTDGTMTTIVTGFTFASAMEFDGDTLYVLNDGLNALGTGQVWAIESFSTVQPQAPAPTTAPVATATAAGIVAPDTGSGGHADSDNAGYGVLMLALAAIAALGGGAALAFRRR